MSRIRSVVVVASAVAVAASALILLLRTGSAISIHNPLFVVTSGAEEEAVLGIVRAMNGEVFTDPRQFPFSASYYNWLFYYLYAWAGRLVLDAGQLDLAWLPTIGRLVSLVGTGFLTVVMVELARIAVRGAGHREERLAVTTALFVGFGPLVGYWAISMHPEVWATAFSAASILAVLRGYPRHTLASLAVASCLSLAAWSMKHIYVFPAFTIGAFLLFRRDWRGLAWTVLLHLAGVGAIFGLGTETFRTMLFFQAASDFSLSQFRINILNLVSKTLPFMVGTVMALVIAWKERQNLRHDYLAQLALYGLGFTLLTIPLSAKEGAAENYYLLLVVFGSLLTVWATRVLAQWNWPPVPSMALALAWVAEAVACLSVLLGLAGSVSVRDIDAKNRAYVACTADLPAPFYSPVPYVNLPWAHEAGPHVVTAYTYYMDRKRGLEYENGGIGGLIQRGYFATLAMSKGVTEWDGADLAQSYRIRVPDCNGLTIWERDNRG